MPHTALGFRVKSGWATAVLLTGPPQSPRVLDRRAIDLSDPEVPKSRQPFHSALGLHQKAGEKAAAKLRKVVERYTKRSITKLIKEYRKSGHDFDSAGLVVGSDLELTKIKQIKNPHIQAHALEGRLFRDALESALRANGVSCLVIVERQVYMVASTCLRRPEDDLQRAVTDLGRAVGGSWRSEDKAATLAAWSALATEMTRDDQLHHQRFIHAKTPV